MQVEARWNAGDADLARKYAAELIALKPDVIVTISSFNAETVIRSGTSVPLVFAIVLDPVGSGLVKAFHDPAAMRPASCCSNIV